MPVHATLGQRAVMGLSWQHVPHMIHVDRTRAAQAPFQQGDSPRSRSGRAERTEIPAGETRPCEVHAAVQYALVRAVRHSAIQSLPPARHGVESALTRFEMRARYTGSG